MCNSYMVKYWTTEGRLTGTIVMANSMGEAEQQTREMPNFSSMANTPEQINI